MKISHLLFCVCMHESCEHVHSCMYVFVYRLEVNIKGLPQSIFSIWDSVFHRHCSSARLAERASPRNPPSLLQVCITTPFLLVSSCWHGKHLPTKPPPWPLVYIFNRIIRAENKPEWALFAYWEDQGKRKKISLNDHHETIVFNMKLILADVCSFGFKSYSLYDF